MGKVRGIQFRSIIVNAVRKQKHRNNQNVNNIMGVNVSKSNHRGPASIKIHFDLRLAILISRHFPIYLFYGMFSPINVLTPAAKK